MPSSTKKPEASNKKRYTKADKALRIGGPALSGTLSGYPNQRVAQRARTAMRAVIREEAKQVAIGVAYIAGVRGTKSISREHVLATLTAMSLNTDFGADIISNCRDALDTFEKENEERRKRAEKRIKEGKAGVKEKVPKVSHGTPSYANAYKILKTTRFNVTGDAAVVLAVYMDMCADKLVETAIEMVPKGREDLREVHVNMALDKLRQEGIFRYTRLDSDPMLMLPLDELVQNSKTLDANRRVVREREGAKRRRELKKEQKAQEKAEAQEDVDAEDSNDADDEASMDYEPAPVPESKEKKKKEKKAKKPKKGKKDKDMDKPKKSAKKKKSKKKKKKTEE